MEKKDQPEGAPSDERFFEEHLTVKTLEFGEFLEKRALVIVAVDTTL